MNNSKSKTNKNNQGGKKSIVAVHMEGSDIDQYRLSDNTTIEEQEAVKMVKNGELDGYMVSNRNGIEYIKGKNDGNRENNLQDLPRF